VLLSCDINNKGLGDDPNYLQSIIPAMKLMATWPTLMIFPAKHPFFRGCPILKYILKPSNTPILNTRSLWSQIWWFHPLNHGLLGGAEGLKGGWDYIIPIKLKTMFPLEKS
jgi:hypothetical protein